MDEAPWDWEDALLDEDELWGDEIQDPAQEM